MGIDDIVRKAKDAATDERIDQVADTAKDVAPESVDAHVDTVAEQAKKLNG